MENTLFIIPIFLLLILIESIWSWRHDREHYDLKETGTNLAVFFGNQLMKPIKLGWMTLCFSWMQSLALFELPTHWSMAIVAIILVDFLYYWQHRLGHEVKFLWAIHHTHHSSHRMNFSAALRINWLSSFIAPIYYFPAFLMGFSVEQVLLFFVINLLYQFWLHTEAVGKIPFVEGWINTPSAHRAHHGSNPQYIDKNYGGILLVWDRLLGTYEAEEEKVEYGVTTGFVGYNPFKVNFAPFVEFFKWRREANQRFWKRLRKA